MSNKKQIKSNQDAVWKLILEVYFQEFIEFFYPEIAKKIDWSYGYVSLEQELQSITTDAIEGKKFVDKLFQVRSLEGEEKEILVQIDVQGQMDNGFPLRLFQYYYRIFDLRKKPIITLTILTDSNKTWHPRNYQAEVWDFPVLNFNFKSCKLLDYWNNKQTLEESNNPFALVVLAHLAFIETKGKPHTRAQIKFSLTRRLYKKGYEKDYIINLFKVLDWVLALPKELALEYRVKIHQLEEEKKVNYITSIEALSLEEGLEKGLREGRQEGRYEVAKNLLAEGMPLNFVRKVTQLPDLELVEVGEI
jgi:predicted transposase/invertase (TIGR01784 family)